MYITWGVPAALGVGALAVVLLPSAGTVVVWVTLIVLAVALDVALTPSPRKLAITREVPRSVRLSQRTAATLTITNGSTRGMRLLVRDGWQPSAGVVGSVPYDGVRSTHVVTEPRVRLDLPAGERRRVTTELIPTRRGDRRAVVVAVRSSGPLRLAGRQRSFSIPGRVRVLPEFAARKHLPSRLARLREIDGAASVNVRGAGTEFDSLREYVIGDDVRSIDWRSTARRADVVVRTWRPERDRKVYVVIDSARLSAVRLAEGIRLDAQIEAALLLAALAGHAGDRIEVVAVDRAIRARATGNGPKVLAGLADQLATVDSSLVELNWAAVFADVTARLNGRSLVVFLTALEPTAIEEGLMPLVGAFTARHQVMLAAAYDPALERLTQSRDTNVEVYDAAAAERVLLEHDATAGLLRRAGVEVVLSSGDRLAPDVADRYLALKAAGRL